MASKYYTSALTKVAGSSTQFTADIYLAGAPNVGSYGVELVVSGEPSGISYSYAAATVSGFNTSAFAGISAFSSSTTMGGTFEPAGTLIGTVTLSFATAPSAAFKLEVLGANLDDIDGNTMPVNWDAFAQYDPASGVTPAPPVVDNLAPTLTSASPADNSTAVAVGSDIVLNLSENVAVGTGNIVISNGAGDIRTINMADASQVTLSMAQVTINPTADLLAGSNYHLQIRSGAIKDLAGNAFTGITDVTTLNFGTAAATSTPAGTRYYATIPIRVAGSSTQFTADIYLAGAPNVGSYGVELVVSGEPSGVSYSYAAATVNGFNTSAFAGISAFSSSTTMGGTFEPAGTLIGAVTLNFATAPSAAFKLEVLGANLDDIDGNTMAVNWDAFALYDPTSSIETVAPILTSASPSDNASSVAVSSNIVLTFSENVVTGTGNIVISNGTDTRTISVTDASQFTLSGTQVTINPTADLLAGGSYNVQMASGVIKDLAGNAFAGIADATTLNFGTAGPSGGTGQTLEVLAYTWKNHTLLSGVTVATGSTTKVTGTDGSASLTRLTDTNVSLQAARDVPSGEATQTDQAVNLQDAIAILKMLVGLDVNGAGKALSPYQALAADYDGNGYVQLTDAIGVLKHVVGLTAPKPAWHFVNELDTTVPGKAPLSPGVPQSSIGANTSGSSPVHVGLVGYLSGDLDGSFAGAAGALDLDTRQNAYFNNLTLSHGLNPSQFGIYIV